MRLSCIIPLVFLCVACADSSDTIQSVPVEQEIIDPRSETFLQEMVEEEHFFGVALVMKGGEIVHAKGYGKATDEKDNTVSTAFHVASITKQFTAAAALQRVEKGIVDLDTSVNAYLPERYRSPRWDSVTIHHLLSHSNGSPEVGQSSMQINT